MIWQKEPHNPSGFLLDPGQSLSAQGISPYYGASILLTRYYNNYFIITFFMFLFLFIFIYCYLLLFCSPSQKKAKHEDNSIDGQINRDLWEELRGAEPEVSSF